MKPGRFLSRAAALALFFALACPAATAKETEAPPIPPACEELEKAGWHPDGATARLIRQARLGNPEAQTELGYRHYLGMGVMRDRTRAHDWYLLAAQAGHPEAQLFLAALSTPDSAVAWHWGRCRAEK